MLRSLFSGALMLFPVFVTLGLYIGVEYQNIVDLFHGKISPSAPGAGGNGAGKANVTTTQFCQQFYGYQPYPGRYIFNPNQWNMGTAGGGLCMNVTADSSVNSTSKYAANWTATWSYPQGSEDSPVHAFPNAKLNSTALPIQISYIANMPFDVEWTYSASDQAAQSIDLAALTAANLNANVCIDMFLSDSQNSSGDPSTATHEVMVWFGQYGLSTQPLGYTAGVSPTATQQVGGVTFNLYNKANANGQEVFTWVAAQNTTEFSGDLMPLITSLESISSGPTSQMYLGYYAFGSEAFYSTTNVTLSVQKLEMDVSQS